MERHPLLRRLIYVAIFFICGWPTNGSAQDSIGNRMLDIWPGGIRGKAGGIFVGERYAFVGVQANYMYGPGTGGAVIFDLSNPERPRRVGALNGYWSHALSDRYWFEYLPSEGSERLYDLADPLEPVSIWTKPDMAFRQWIANGAYGFGIDGTNLLSFDMTDVAQPRQIGELTLPAPAGSPRLFGNIIVATAFQTVSDEATFFFIDVSNSAQPRLAGSYKTTNGFEITIGGNRAYVATQAQLQDYVIEILDISDLANPKKIGEFNFFSQFLSSLSTFDNLLITTDYSRGLLVFDVTDPAFVLPVAVSSGYGSSAHVRKGNLIYFTTLYGFKIVDLTFAVAPREVCSVSTGDITLGAFAAGNRVFVADYYSNLKILDATDPAQLKPIGKYPLSVSAVAGVEVYANSAYVLSSNIYQLDLSKPGDPPLKSKTIIDGVGSSMTLSASNLIVGTMAGTIRIFDVALSEPTPRGSVSLTGGVLRVAANSNFAFATLAGQSQGGSLAAIDISNPNNPRILSIVTNIDYSNQLAVKGGAICVGTTAGLQVFELDTSHQLQKRAELILSNTQPSIASGPGNSICILSLANNFTMVDVSDPSAPTVINRWTGLPANIGNLSVNGDVAYIAAQDFGLLTINIGATPSPPILHVDVDGETHLIRWAPPDDDQIKLEHSSSLAGPWQPADTNRIVSGLFQTATIPSRGAAEFYRLKK